MDHPFQKERNNKECILITESETSILNGCGTHDPDDIIQIIKKNYQ